MEIHWISSAEQSCHSTPLPWGGGVCLCKLVSWSGSLWTIRTHICTAWYCDSRGDWMVRWLLTPPVPALASLVDCLLMQEMRVWSLGQEHSLEEEMTAHSSILAWEIPWIEKSGGLQSMGWKKSQTWLSSSSSSSNWMHLQTRFQGWRKEQMWKSDRVALHPSPPLAVCTNFCKWLNLGSPFPHL